MLRTGQLLHPASTPASQPTPEASLPGTLASPRTGLAPAGYRELVVRLHQVMASPPCPGVRTAGRTAAKRQRARDRGLAHAHPDGGHRRRARQRPFRLLPLLRSHRPAGSNQIWGTSWAIGSGSSVSAAVPSSAGLGSLPAERPSWVVRAEDNLGAASSWSAPWSFNVDLRLGSRASYGQDNLGPVTVNLANGNAMASWSSPSSTTVGGPLGISLAYNSDQAGTGGLSAQYYMDTLQQRSLGSYQPVLQRRDPQVDFVWPDAPDPALNSNWYLAR